MSTLQDMIQRLQRFGDEIRGLSGKSYTILPDESGMIDRQCPQCNEFFMVDDKDWDKLAGIAYCPFCRHSGKRGDFITKAHHKEAKECLENALHESWDHDFPIPNNFLQLHSALNLEGKTKCVNCDSAFSTSRPAQGCPFCGAEL